MSLNSPVLSRRSAEIAASFGARAESYERHAGLQHAVAERLARLLPQRTSPNVLELGCGTGLFSRHLLSRYPEGRFVLTDAAPAMIAECRHNLAAADQSRISFEVMDAGEAGDNVGCLLRGIDKDAVERGQVLCKPGSIKPHKKFMGEVYVLKKEEGGRHTPFFTNYRPQFYIRTTDVTGSVMLPEGVKMVMPGDNVTVEVELITTVALEEQMRFAIREGGKTVGAGVVTKIIE